MLGIGPQKGVALLLPVKLMKSDMSGFKVTPVIAAGDFTIEKWNFNDAFTQKTSSIANLTNTPIVADSSASCTTVMLSLTATEMDADMVIITARDVDGANDWGDNSWPIYPDSRKADIATALSNLNTIDTVVDALTTNLATVDTVVDGLAVTLVDLDSEVDDIHNVVHSIAVTGAALTTVAVAPTVTQPAVGTETSGSYQSTQLQDGSYHVITAASNTIDHYYQFQLPTRGVPVSVFCSGYLREGAPAGGDTLQLQAYNFLTAQWEVIHPDIFTGLITAGPNQEHTVTLLARNTDENGVVRIRFYSASLEAGTTLNLDQIHVAYAESITGDIALIKAKTDNLPSGVKRGVALSNFEIYMQSSADTKLPAVGETVSGSISKDGGALAPLTNSVAGIGSGLYKVDLTSGEMDAGVLTLVFTSTNSVQKVLTILTN